MKLQAKLTQAEIKDAIRDFVQKKTGGTVEPNGITVHIDCPPEGSRDPREHRSVTATVSYEGKAT